MCQIFRSNQIISSLRLYTLCFFTARPSCFCFWTCYRKGAAVSIATPVRSVHPIDTAPPLLSFIIKQKMIGFTAAFLQTPGLTRIHRNPKSVCFCDFSKKVLPFCYGISVKMGPPAMPPFSERGYPVLEGTGGSQGKKGNCINLITPLVIVSLLLVPFAFRHAAAKGGCLLLSSKRFPHDRFHLRFPTIPRCGC